MLLYTRVGRSYTPGRRQKEMLDQQVRNILNKNNYNSNRSPLSQSYLFWAYKEAVDQIA